LQEISLDEGHNALRLSEVNENSVTGIKLTTYHHRTDQTLSYFVMKIGTFLHCPFKKLICLSK